MQVIVDKLAVAVATAVAAAGYVWFVIAYLVPGTLVWRLVHMSIVAVVEEKETAETLAVATVVEQYCILLNGGQSG